MTWMNEDQGGYTAIRMELQPAHMVLIDATLAPCSHFSQRDDLPEPLRDIMALKEPTLKQENAPIPSQICWMAD